MNQTNPTSGGEGTYTGGVAGDWDLARGRVLGQLESCQARMLACAFLDHGKILLRQVLGRYLSDAVSKQILRGEILGGSRSGLRHQMVRFGRTYWDTQLKCSKRPV